MIETCDVLTLGTTFAGAVKGLLGVLLSAHTRTHMFSYCSSTLLLVPCTSREYGKWNGFIIPYSRLLLPLINVHRFKCNSPILLHRSVLMSVHL